jgi:hypothetical protein
MPKDRQVVFIGNNRPALLGQYPYWEKPWERRRALRSPYYPKGLPDPPASIWPRWIGGQGLRLLSFVLGPHPQVTTAALAFFIWWSNPMILIGQNVERQTGVLHCEWITWQGPLKWQEREPTPINCSLGHLWVWIF